MSAPSRIGEVMALDRLVHEPARLLILAVLANAKEVEAEEEDEAGTDE